MKAIAVKRPYYLLDVFTDTPLAGNPLAVVMESAGLEAERMQAIAREFNLSETVFVFDPHDPVNSARVRIFTTAKELPFAGHPTVGTAGLLAELRASDYLKNREVSVILEETIGKVSCTVRRSQKKTIYAQFDLPALPRLSGTPSSTAQIAAALDLLEEDIGFAAHVPSLYSAGVPAALVPIKDLAAMARVKPNRALFDETFGSAAVYLYTDETTAPNLHYHARMFSPALGVFEDPATGSAAAALAGALVALETPEDGDYSLSIEQGVEMGRPSLIVLDLVVQDGGLRHASIGGPLVIVGEGSIDL